MLCVNKRNPADVMTELSFVKYPVEEPVRFVISFWSQQLTHTKPYIHSRARAANFYDRKLSTAVATNIAWKSLRDFFIDKSHKTCATSASFLWQFQWKNWSKHAARKGNWDFTGKL